MKTVKLTKIEIVEIEVLQSQLQNYLTYKNATLPASSLNTVAYFETLLVIDLLQKLYYNFRSKIERTAKTHSSLNFSISEAVILLQCCNSVLTMQNDYEKFVQHKISGLLHKELINLY